VVAREEDTNTRTREHAHARGARGVRAGKWVDLREEQLQVLDGRHRGRESKFPPRLASPTSEFRPRKIRVGADQSSCPLIEPTLATLPLHPSGAARLLYAVIHNPTFDRSIPPSVRVIYSGCNSYFFDRFIGHLSIYVRRPAGP